MMNLLENAYDIHIHSAPDVVKRKSSDAEIARDVIKYGMKGYVIKSHYFNTAGRAALIRELIPGCNAIGALVLNNSVGGLNPAAVEMAAKAGTKIIWFPTMDAQNMWDFLTRTNAEVPFGSAHTDPSKVSGISLLKDGKLKPEVYEILELIKKYDLVLASGHVSNEEALALFQAGNSYGIKKMIATHVEFPPTYATVERQREYIRYGAMIEHNYVTIINKDYTYQELMEQIEAVGAEHVILSSDLGQHINPAPIEGFNCFLNELHSAGVSKEDIKTMVVRNTQRLVE